MKLIICIWTVLVIVCIPFFAQNSFAQCSPATAQIDLDVNNVSARLLVGGDLWWDGNDGRYIVPKVEPGLPEVSALFSGGLWMGGFDAGGNLKVAAQTYGTSNNFSDYWPGPLDEIGSTTIDDCANFDRFWTTNSVDINAHIADWNDNGNIEGPIPASLLAWPGRGNPHFFDSSGFDLPQAPQGLAPFHDENSNGQYDPENGDYPDINNADQGTWWVFNDAGNIHTETGTQPLMMEVQVLAYAYTSTNQNFNNATFYDYKTIYRGFEPLDSAYLGIWIDPDLGCYQDDYVGCDSTQNLAYVYNMDAVDGLSSCSDCFGVNTYCEDIPIVGVKILEGAIAFENNEIVDRGMSNFMYVANGGVPSGGTIALQSYNLLSGSWPDGTRLTKGGDGYNPGSTDYTTYAYPSAPDDSEGWSMCTENVGEADQRMVMGSGPFTLNPGSINKLSFAVIYADNISYPCPDISPLLEAANDVQDLHDGLATATEELATVQVEIKFLPNPMSNQAELFFEDLENKVRQINIFSLEGKLIRKVNNITGNSILIEKGSLGSGIYFYTILTSDLKIHSGKFIVQ